MNRIYANTDVGKKNILLGFALFLILGVVVGIPLTVNFMGGAMLAVDRYQAWKVLHGYGVFLAFINFFFGYCIDPMPLTRVQKEYASWAFLIAGLLGGIGRLVIALIPALGGYGVYINLLETAGFVLGTLVFLRALTKKDPARQFEQAAPAI